MTAWIWRTWREEKEEFLREFLTLDGGSPSPDPDQFRACFQQFMARVAEDSQGVIAIDSKVF